jgi:hypothetical protein
VSEDELSKAGHREFVNLDEPQRRMGDSSPHAFSGKYGIVPYKKSREEEEAEDDSLIVTTKKGRTGGVWTEPWAHTFPAAGEEATVSEEDEGSTVSEEDGVENGEAPADGKAPAVVVEDSSSFVVEESSVASKRSVEDMVGKP